MISRSDLVSRFRNSPEPISRAERSSESKDTSNLSGFTLIEMLTVIVILGLLVTFATRGQALSPANQARSTAQAIAGALRSARSDALVGNRMVDFEINAPGRFYRSGAGAPVPLSQALAVSLVTSADETGAAGHIRFESDGSSSGGRIRIGGGNRTWTVGVDWLSGRVSLAEQR